MRVMTGHMMNVSISDKIMPRTAKHSS